MNICKKLSILATIISSLTMIWIEFLKDKKDLNAMKYLYLAIFIFLSFSFLFAGIINIPDDYTTIQAGINASINGDTVLVQPGKYKGGFSFNNKKIIVGSLFIINNDTNYISQTIIEDGGVTFKNREDSTTILIGFTVTNYGDWSDGIYCENKSSPTLKNLIIRENKAMQGAGIYCQDKSNPYIKDVKIISNISNDNGGGIYIRMNSNPTFENVEISGNTAYFKGGGIYCENSSPTFINVIIKGNETIDENGWGGGIYCENSNLILFNVTINENSSTLRGGGIVCNNNSDCSMNYVFINNNITSEYGGGLYCSSSKPTLNNVTIQNNASNGSEGKGGGVCLLSSDLIVDSALFRFNSAITDGGGIYCESSYPFLNNCTISENSANNGAGIYCKFSEPHFESIDINNNIASNNGGGIYLYAFRPDFLNINILGNSADKGGGIYCLYAHPILNNAKICENNAEWGGGTYCDNSSPKFYNGIISENSATAAGGGIFCIYNSCPLISFVTIFNNYANENGGGISCNISSNLTIVNSTISLNSANQNGGGLYCLSSSPFLINTIFWNDSQHEIYFYQDEKPDSITIAYSNIQGGESGIVKNSIGTINWLEGNNDCDPIFIDSEQDNFYLQENSPCIDAGTAFFIFNNDTIINLNPSEYIGTAPEIGILEIPYILGINKNLLLPNQILLYQNYPNPFNSNTRISYKLTKTSFVKLSIFDINGRLIKTLFSERQDAGNYSINWNSNNLSSGVYFYRIDAGEFNSVKKCLLIK